MKRIKTFVVGASMLLVGAGAYAQNESVGGKVTDSNGEPIIGATVKVKNGGVILRVQLPI